MFFDNNTSGSFTGVKDQGFKENVTKLKESMAVSGLDYARDIGTILSHSDLNDSYMGILTEDYNPDTKGVAGTDVNTHNNNVQLFLEQAENARKQILSESQGTGNLNPIVGLTMPLLKMYWIKNRYKDVLPTEVATLPTIKRSVERQYLQDSEGNIYMLPDIFEDSAKAYDILMKATRQQLNADPITVPQFQFNLMEKAGGSRRQDDQISRNFYISKITVDKTGLNDESGSPLENDLVLDNLRIKVDAGSGLFTYDVMYQGKVIDALNGSLDFTTGLLNVGSAAGKIKSINVFGYLSSENNLRTASTNWKRDDFEFNIPDGEHLNTGLTKERIQDENVIYNIDSATKAIQQMTDVIGQLKDLKIKKFLDDSKLRIKGSRYFKSCTFSCKPPTRYNGTPTEWRNTELKGTLDRLCLTMGKILKDETISFIVLTSRLNASYLDNVQWGYGAADQSQAGGCTLDYNIGLYNNMRNFKIVSSERQSDDALQILVIPQDADHLTYIQFEYQFIISNEYREAGNVRVPSVMVSDRYLTEEITPVQGELAITHNGISTDDIEA